MKSWLGLVAVAVLGLALDAGTTEAGFFRGRGRSNCGSDCGATCNACCAAPCQTQYTWENRTVMVPQMVPESRTITCWENKFETRQQQVTRCRCVPVTQEVPYTYTVCQPETRTQTVNYNVCVPIQREIQYNYTVCQPETRTQTRTVAKCVPETTTRPVTRDMGHWEDRCVQVASASDCGTCGSYGGGRRGGLFSRRRGGSGGDCCYSGGCGSCGTDCCAQTM